MPDFAANSIFFALFSCLLGLALGSFYANVAARYLAGSPLIRPHFSVCPACGHRLKAWENIPVVSYFLVRGHCLKCGAGISALYPVTEALAGLWGLALGLAFPPGPAWLVYTLMGGVLITAAIIDLASFILPDFLTLPGAAVSIVCAALVLDKGWRDPLLGAAIGAGLFWGLQVFWRGLRKTDGLGTGDIKLMAMIGGLLGPLALAPVITLASVTGLIAGLLRLLRPGAKGLKTAIPFGPFLSLAALIYILFGQAFWRWYLG